MNALLYYFARALIACLQALPLAWVARLGRCGGALAHLLDHRHRRVVTDNLQRCFAGERSVAELRAIARENFRRIGENYACGIKTASMDEMAIRRCVEFAGEENIRGAADQSDHRSRIIAIGHFGNFELYARASYWVKGFQFATTYRGLPQPALNRLLLNTRTKSGCLFFERRTQSAELREALGHQRLMLGLLVDQHAGDRGLPIPFFGHACSTSMAPAVYALRYDCPLHVAICYRIGLGRWRIELGAEIPTRRQGQPRLTEEILADINQAYELAIRRDPANWFWVHRRWKPIRRKSRLMTGQDSPI